jgi:hypothetical protein
VQLKKEKQVTGSLTEIEMKKRKKKKAYQQMSREKHL